MGKFTLLDFDEHNSSKHHKRTTRFAFKIMIEDREALKAAVETEDEKWSGDEVSINKTDGYSWAQISYGPVHGAYISDLRRFMNKHEINMINEPNIVNTEHVADDSCRHKEHA